jgi:hypothetical protein
MTTTYSNIFLWWEVSIIWCTAFLTVAAIYLYADSARKNGSERLAKPRNVLENFVFVWILLALLGLYIITITSASQPIFVAGNLIVEIVLIVYILTRGRGDQSMTSIEDTSGDITAGESEPDLHHSDEGDLEQL